MADTPTAALRPCSSCGGADLELREAGEPGPPYAWVRCRGCEAFGPDVKSPEAGNPAADALMRAGARAAWNACVAVPRTSA